MKIAVTSTGPTLEDNVEARFGRCPYFLIIETDDMQVEALENPNISLGGGAGIQSAQLMSGKDVTTVLTGNCGPNAFNVFGQAGIQVVAGVSGIVRDAVEQFMAGNLSSASTPSVDSRFGMSTKSADPAPAGQPMVDPMGQGSGTGVGMGAGRGMGRGMGRGGGMGRGIGRGMGSGRSTGQRMEPQIDTAGSITPDQPKTVSLSKEEELKQLKDQASALQKQMEALESSIKNLEK